MKFNEEIEKYICDNYYSRTGKSLSLELSCSTTDITNIWKKYSLHGKQKRTYSINEDYFNKIDTIDKAYFLGFIASDGCLFNKNENKTKDDSQNIIKITISKTDVAILEKFKKYIKTDKPIGKEHGKYVVLELVSDKMYNDIVSLGIKPNKTYGNAVANVDDNFMRHFIRGYFDGDGSISFNKAKTELDIGVSISGYKQNMQKIISYLETKNIFTSFFEDRRKYNGSDKFGFMACTNKTNKYSFLRFIYDDCEDIYLDRKYLLAHKFMDIIEKDSRNSQKEIVTYYEYAVKNKICG